MIYCICSRKLCVCKSEYLIDTDAVMPRKPEYGRGMLQFFQLVHIYIKKKKNMHTLHVNN